MSSDTNAEWVNLTVGELALAKETLGHAIKDLHAWGWSEGDLATLGVVHRVLYTEHRLRKGSVLANVAVETGSRHRRRAVK